MAETMSSTTPTPELETAVQSLPDGIPFDASLGRKPLLLTFEIGAEVVLWSAVPLRSSRKSKFSKEAVAIGYNDFDRLAEWFDKFRQAIGESHHRIHLHVSGSEILHRCFMIPVVPKSELAAVVRSHAKRIYPFDIDKALFAWKTIDKVDWAGGPKYEISSQALGEHWKEWLSRLFGELTENIDLITSTGRHFGHLLRQIDKEFTAADAYLIQLKANELETGFFHKGHLEFFREVSLESLKDSGFIDQMREIVGSEQSSESTDVLNEPVIEEIQTVISDALDYYYGQFGQRGINVVYLCLSHEHVPAISAFLEARLHCRVVDLCEQASVSAHNRLAGVIGASDSLARWASVFPKRSPGKELVDLSPPSVKKSRREKVVFRYSLLTLSLLVVAMIALSVFKEMTISISQDQLDQFLSTFSLDEATEELAAIESAHLRLAELQQNLGAVATQRSHSFVTPLKLISHISRKEIKLNSVELLESADGQSLTLRIEGVIYASPDHQEALLYAYISSLESQSYVKSVELDYKRTTSQFANQQTNFGIQVVVAG